MGGIILYMALKQRDDGAEDQRDDQTGQHVHGLAVLDPQNGQAGAENEEAADDGKLGHHVRCHESAEGKREQICWLCVQFELFGHVDSHAGVCSSNGG